MLSRAVANSNSRYQAQNSFTRNETTRAQIFSLERRIRLRRGAQCLSWNPLPGMPHPLDKVLCLNSCRNVWENWYTKTITTPIWPHMNTAIEWATLVCDSHYCQANQHKTLTSIIEHCLEQIRQSSICNGDVNVIPYSWLCNEEHLAALPAMQFGSLHQCVNWKKLDGWVKARRLDLFDEGLPVPAKPI